MTGKVMRLMRYREKGAAGEELTEVRLVERLGMEENLHQGGERQLCLLTAEARRWMDTQIGKGLCFHRFKENLLLEDVALEHLTSGDLLEIGDVRLRISGHSKRCYEECPLFLSGMDCRLSNCAAFAVVEAGGIVRVGSRVVCRSGTSISRGDDGEEAI